MQWNGVIFGPDDTPWDGGTFKLTLEFTEVNTFSAFLSHRRRCCLAAGAARAAARNAPLSSVPAVADASPPARCHAHTSIRRTFPPTFRLFVFRSAFWTLFPLTFHRLFRTTPISRRRSSLCRRSSIRTSTRKHTRQLPENNRK